MAADGAAAAPDRYRRNRLGVAGARRPGPCVLKRLARSKAAARKNGFARRVSAPTYRGGAPQLHQATAPGRDDGNLSGVAGARRPGFVPPASLYPRGPPAARPRTHQGAEGVPVSPDRGGPPSPRLLRGGAPRLHQTPRQRAKNRARGSPPGPALLQADLRRSRYAWRPSRYPGGPSRWLPP